MNVNPLISIVIPHFNRADLLSETISSIKVLDYGNWEAIIVDDGSDDSEWQAIQEFAEDRIRIIQRKDGIKGPSRCRNLGVTESSGDYIVFVDADDLLAPWCLSQRMEKVAEVPMADLWVFKVMLFKERSGDLAVCWNRLEGDDDLQRFLRSDPPWHTSSPLWSKDAFLAVGGFNEGVFYGDDSDLHTRTLLLDKRIEKFPDLLPDAFVRRGEVSRITNRLDQAMIESRQVRLHEGTQTLKNLNISSELMQIWEGQYFVEGEELLFNVENAQQEVRNVISGWTIQFSPPAYRRWAVQVYFWIGILVRDRAYLLLRIMRRLVMTMLPSYYFPSGGKFQSWQLSDDETRQIKERLRNPDIVNSRLRDDIGTGLL